MFWIKRFNSNEKGAPAAAGAFFGKDRKTCRGTTADIGHNSLLSVKAVLRYEMTIGESAVSEIPARIRAFMYYFAELFSAVLHEKEEIVCTEETQKDGSNIWTL